MKFLLLLLSLLTVALPVSSQDSYRCVFRIGVLDYSRNIDAAWLAPANLQGVQLSKRETSSAPSSKRAEGKLRLSRANLSTSWLHANVIGRRLVFYEQEPRPGAEPPPVVAEAVFQGPNLPRFAYLFFIPTPGEESPYRVIAIDAATRTFPPSSHLVVNLTDQSVRGFFGDQSFKINPEGRTLVKGIGKTNPRGYFKVYFDHGTEPDWNRIALTQWKADPTAQRICLVYRKGPRVAIRTFNQYVKAIEAPEMPVDTREPVTAPE